jgi:amino acid permease
MGIFVTSGELIGISGSIGCVISYICAAFIIIPVMRTIAELMAIRPNSGALMDYPYVLQMKVVRKFLLTDSVFQETLLLILLWGLLLAYHIGEDSFSLHYIQTR